MRLEVNPQPAKNLRVEVVAVELIVNGPFVALRRRMIVKRSMMRSGRNPFSMSRKDMLCPMLGLQRFARSLRYRDRVWVIGPRRLPQAGSEQPALPESLS